MVVIAFSSAESSPRGSTGRAKAEGENSSSAATAARQSFTRIRIKWVLRFVMQGALLRLFERQHVASRAHVAQACPAEIDLDERATAAIGRKRERAGVQIGAVIGLFVRVAEDDLHRFGVTRDAC